MLRRDNARGVAVHAGRPRGNGYWIEETGPLRPTLTVDIVNGGRHWRARSATLMNVPLPMVLCPRGEASKTIVGNRYRYFVGFAVPAVGTALSYGGDLTLSQPPDRSP
jgi:hypothetical protein